MTFPDRPVHIVGIAGSLRQGSINRAVLRAAARVAPAGAVVEPFEIRDIPVYDEDVRRAGQPPGVAALWNAVRAADGVLFVTPEYNQGLPGVMKNVIDWLSRPPAESPWDGKPAGLIGATDGPWGTLRAQQQLRLALAAVGALPIARPVLALAHADKLLGPDGEVADATTLERLAAYVSALEAWIRRLG